MNGRIGSYADLVYAFYVMQRVERWTCSQQVVGLNHTRAKLLNNIGQVVHTYVPLSPSSITWYFISDGFFVIKQQVCNLQPDM